MKARIRILLLVILVTAASGCHTRGYQKDRSVGAFHLIGVGWINSRSGTNSFRSLVLGSLGAASIRGPSNTNAPMSFTPQPLGMLINPP